jgi:6,7-dimethyl-8-ribityllumazine synthase
MLKSTRRAVVREIAGGRFAIVASKYNARFVDSMLASAELVLRKARAAEIHVVRVPGAFEIPVVAAKLASGSWGPLSALLCLGVILRGETTHAQFIGESVTNALAQIQIRYHIPIIHEVLLLENEKQAEARCLDPEHNRGAEAAYTALEMAETMPSLSKALRRSVRSPKVSGS